MMLPNLAGRPFLNTRPVWLVTGAAGFLTVVLVILNIAFYVSSNRTLAPQIEERDQLQAEHDLLVAELEEKVAVLSKVPWKSLVARVNATNQILREHAFSWLTLLDDIERVMPYDVRIVQISPTVGSNQVNLSLTVVTKNRDAMLEFLENLIADPSFTRPTPSRERTPEESDAVGYQLALSVEYLSGGEQP
jgi:Tfp pilus assembly protein PilN